MPTEIVLDTVLLIVREHPGSTTQLVQVRARDMGLCFGYGVIPKALDALRQQERVVIKERRWYCAEQVKQDARENG